MVDGYLFNELAALGDLRDRARSQAGAMVGLGVASKAQRMGIPGELASRGHAWLIPPSPHATTAERRVIQRNWP